MAKRAAFGVVVVLLAVAYLAGYWPERQRRVAIETEVAGLRSALGVAEARVRMAGLLEELLTLTEAVAAMNYGQAQDLSSRFFDRVQAAAPVMEPPAFRTALEAIAESRDGVTAALARGDQVALDSLRRAQQLLREALRDAGPTSG
jgi:hypothetical protein